MQPDRAPERPAASGRLNEHLAATALGGNHPLMVVVPRDALKAMLAELDLVRSALDEIADVSGRSVTSIIARRALDGLR